MMLLKTCGLGATIRPNPSAARAASARRMNSRGRLYHTIEIIEFADALRALED
jgi:hypothetical protein